MTNHAPVEGHTPKNFGAVQSGVRGEEGGSGKRWERDGFEQNASNGILKELTKKKNEEDGEEQREEEKGEEEEELKKHSNKLCCCCWWW